MTLGKVYGFDFIAGQPSPSPTSAYKWTPISEMTYYETMEKKVANSEFIGQKTRV